MLILKILICGLLAMVKELSINAPINGIESYVNRPSFSKDNCDPCKELKVKLIKEIVKKSLIELAVALAFSAAACLFVATPAGMVTLLITSVTAVALNILIRSTSAFCIYRQFLLKNKNSPKAVARKALLEKAIDFLQYLEPLVFSSRIDAKTRDLIVHEGGHALAAKILIKNPSTRITLFPAENRGLTTYRVGALTQIGEFFGRAKSKLIIAAAGPALAVVTATVGFAASLALRKSKPELSRYLKVMSIDSISRHVFIALSALLAATKDQKGHDFVQLMAGGVHPIVGAISMIALPLIVRIGFFIYDKIKEKTAEKAAAREAKHSRKEYMIQLPFQNGSTLVAAYSI